MRLFIAIPIPEEIKDTLIPHLDGVPGKFRIVPRENLHVTVLFLGEVEKSNLEGIKASLDSVSSRHAPFEMQIKDVGVGPRPSKPRLIWARFKSNDAFSALCDDVRTSLAPYHLNQDTRPPRPHITLARFSRGQQDHFFSSPSIIEYSLPVSKVELWLSILGPSGAKYEPLSSFPLKQNPSYHSVH